jgi:hypothetical protein
VRLLKIDTTQENENVVGLLALTKKIRDETIINNALL